MSSGFFSFFAHTGFLSVLEAEKLLPTRLSGSSAGALVGGMFASGLSTATMEEELLKLRREDFWDVGIGPGLLRGDLFQSRVGALLPAKDFEGCRIPVSVSVFHIRTRKTHVIDSGALAPALCASCAVPGMFHPIRVKGTRYWDGGVLDRPGLLGMQEHEQRGGKVLFHHIESRSPWRAKDSEAMTIPRRDNVVTLVLTDLPRSGPFSLDAGRAALQVAREKTRRALSAPIVDGIVRI